MSRQGRANHNCWQGRVISGECRQRKVHRQTPDGRLGGRDIDPAGQFSCPAGRGALFKQRIRSVPSRRSAFEKKKRGTGDLSGVLRDQPRGRSVESRRATLVNCASQLGGGGQDEPPKARVEPCLQTLSDLWGVNPTFDQEVNGGPGMVTKQKAGGQASGRNSGLGMETWRF
jgi:hypothetical protein